jgi:hypothetical protein
MQESVLLTYFRALAMLVPALVVWLFQSSFLLPKVKWLWANTDLPGSSAEWILDSAIFLTQFMNIAVPLMCAAFLLPEWLWPKWSRYRGVAVAFFTSFVNAVVLLGTTAISTAIVVAIPIVGKVK